jgi:NADH:ubiquinone oxidoreductase subunit C
MSIDETTGVGERKDFPSTGHVEVRCDEAQKRDEKKGTP